MPAVHKRLLPFKSPLKCENPVSFMPLGSGSCLEHCTVTLQSSHQRNTRFDCNLLICRQRRGTVKRPSSGLQKRRQTQLQASPSYLPLPIVTYSNTKTDCQDFLSSSHHSPLRNFSSWKHSLIKSRIHSRGTRPNC